MLHRIKACIIRAMKIGVISDTHGDINPAAFNVFNDVELILHAGDIGNSDIITELEALAPVTAVLGNTDGFNLAGRYPEREIIYIKGKKVYTVLRLTPQGRTAFEEYRVKILDLLS